MLKNLIFCLCLVSFSGLALNEKEQAVLNQVFQILRETVWPKIEIQEQGQPNWNFIQKVSDFSKVLKCVTDDREARELMLAIREGLYSEEGTNFYAMLQDAARDPEHRESFIRGMKWEKAWEFPGISLIWEKLRGTSPLILFGNSQLKKDIDAFQEKTYKCNVSIPNYAEIQSDQFSCYEPYFELFVRLKEQLPEMIELLFGHYTQKSLKNLDAVTLEELLRKLIGFLDDKEKGMIGFFQKALPRS